MVHHHTRTTVSAAAYGSKCGKVTQHRADDRRTRPCLPCMQQREGAHAYSLAPSGPPAACAFPGCMPTAFHDGDHQVPPREAPPRPQKIYHCVVCGRGFVVYGEYFASELRTCGSPECVLHFAAQTAEPLSVLCPCL